MEHVTTAGCLLDDIFWHSARREQFKLMMVSAIYLTFVAIVAVESQLSSICPCLSSTDISVSKAPLSTSGVREQLLLCVEDTHVTNSMFASLSPKSLNLNYRIINNRLHHHEGKSESESSSGNSKCSVIVSIVNKVMDRNSRNERCPGICKDVPVVSVPLQFLRPLDNQTSSTFTRCSLNLTVSSQSLKDPTFLGLALRSIASRKLEECNEKIEHSKDSWDYVPADSELISNISATAGGSIVGTIVENGFDYLSPSLSVSSPTRRRVYGVILWIASLSRIKMAENQLKVLSLQRAPRDDSQRIVGWIAAEDVYPCLEGSGICRGEVREKKSDSNYKVDMPRTFLQDKGTLPGWACAQRRPLRAMAHVLRLYDPDFLLVADDDTFVNMKFLDYRSLWGTYIQTVMKQQNIVLGELNYRSLKITSNGFYFGGSGYLMGRGVLSQLVSSVIHSHGHSVNDKFRTASQIENLGVLSDAVNLSNASCSQCIRVRPTTAALNISGSSLNVTGTADLTLRAVDLCVNMMAQTGTCYHSDHSITRCLAHGIYADTVTADCYSPRNTSFETGEYSLLSMCYEGEKCDLETALTCHRFVANPRDPELPPISTIGVDGSVSTHNKALAHDLKSPPMSTLSASCG